TCGAVWMTRDQHSQRLRRAKRALREGDELHLYYNPEVLREVPPPPTLIADRDGYSVWRKPYGLRSQGSKWGDHCTLARWAQTHLQPERAVFTVHRLDRAANGIMLVAHSKRIAAALAEHFRKRRVEKRYRALVLGECLAVGELLRITTPIDGKEAVSEVTCLAVGADRQRSLVDVRIETGRKHQIRRHLSELGHAVVGDRRYGDPLDRNVEDLQLTAYLLAFECPVSGEAVEYRLADEDLPQLKA
ncbi:MAG: RNA pseudouridine synthase, partial [Pseudomonadota bacterium]